MKTITIQTPFNQELLTWFRAELLNLVQWNKQCMKVTHEYGKFNICVQCFNPEVPGQVWWQAGMSEKDGISVTTFVNANFITLRKGIRFNMNKGTMTLS